MHDSRGPPISDWTAFGVTDKLLSEMQQSLQRRWWSKFSLSVAMTAIIGAGALPGQAPPPLTPAPGATPAEARVYRNREERRAESPKRLLADGVGLAIIADLESGAERRKPFDQAAPRSWEHDDSQSLELQLEVTRLKWLHAAVVWE